MSNDRPYVMSTGWVADAHGTLDGQALVRYARSLEWECERLREVVAKLPLTADDVPVVPGMELWDATNGERHYAWRFVRLGRGVLGIETCEEKIALELLYSTEKAAKAAGGAT
jgi:hypothetical protein